MEGYNGVGPWWITQWGRDTLTAWSNIFFEEANPQRHDNSYKRGYPDRFTCDREYFKAMVRDATRKTDVTLVFAGLATAIIFWSMIRMFGWLSYNYNAEDGLN